MWGRGATKQQKRATDGRIALLVNPKVVPTVYSYFFTNTIVYEHFDHFLGFTGKA